MDIRKLLWLILVSLFLNSCTSLQRMDGTLEIITPTAPLSPTITLPTIPSVTPFSTSTLPSPYDCVSSKNSYQTASLTKVIDGDTIEVQIEGQTYRVRYIGIDTPERGDYGFKDATDFNSSLLKAGEIILIKDVSETDRYDRLLRYVFVDGLFINYELVRQGYAYAVSFPPDIACQELFMEGQREAVENQRGLWQDLQE